MAEMIQRTEEEELGISVTRYTDQPSSRIVLLQEDLNKLQLYDANSTETIKNVKKYNWYAKENRKQNTVKSWFKTRECIKRILKKEQNISSINRKQLQILLIQYYA